MEHNREDLARDALNERENCKVEIERLSRKTVGLKTEISEMKAAEKQLEAKRHDIRTRKADEFSADNKVSKGEKTASYSDRTERRMDRIANLEKRTDFTLDNIATSRKGAAIDRDLEELRRDSIINEELEAMRQSKTKASKAPKKKPARRTKAA